MRRCWLTSSAGIPLPMCKCDTLYREEQPRYNISTESNSLLHGASLFPVISIVTESNTSTANNTIKANCCCVLQLLLDGTAGRVGVIDHRCFSFSVPVYHSGITVDGQDEVSGFLVQVSHSSSGTSTITFSSFVIFSLYSSKIKVWGFFLPLSGLFFSIAV